MSDKISITTVVQDGIKWWQVFCNGVKVHARPSKIGMQEAKGIVKRWKETIRRDG